MNLQHKTASIRLQWNEKTLQWITWCNEQSSSSRTNMIRKRALFVSVWPSATFLLGNNTKTLLWLQECERQIGFRFIPAHRCESELIRQKKTLEYLHIYGHTVKAQSDSYWLPVEAPPTSRGITWPGCRVSLPCGCGLSVDGRLVAALAGRVGVRYEGRLLVDVWPGVLEGGVCGRSVGWRVVDGRIGIVVGHVCNALTKPHQSEVSQRSLIGREIRLSINNLKVSKLAWTNRFHH